MADGRDYDAGMLGLMSRHRVTEVEVVSGIILRNPSRRRARESDEKVTSCATADSKELVITNYRALCDSVKDAADAFMNDKKLKTPLQPRQVFALAAYQVTYVDMVKRDVLLQLGTPEFPNGTRVEGGKKRNTTT